MSPPTTTLLRAPVYLLLRVLQVLLSAAVFILASYLRWTDFPDDDSYSYLHLSASHDYWSSLLANTLALIVSAITAATALSALLVLHFAKSRSLFSIFVWWELACGLVWAATAGASAGALSQTKAWNSGKPLLRVMFGLALIAMVLAFVVAFVSRGMRKDERFVSRKERIRVVVAPGVVVDAERAGEGGAGYVYSPAQQMQQQLAQHRASRVSPGQEEGVYEPGPLPAKGGMPSAVQRYT